jgi:hypothetical protein
MANDLTTHLHKLQDAYAAEMINADASAADLAKLHRKYSADTVDAP